MFVRHGVMYAGTCSEDMMCCMQELVVKSVRNDVLCAGSSGEECLLDMMCCMQALVVKT